MQVALRKGSVDRNLSHFKSSFLTVRSLSARGAWIEIMVCFPPCTVLQSLSARGAWIEIPPCQVCAVTIVVALRKGSVDRNVITSTGLK